MIFPSSSCYPPSSCPTHEDFLRAHSGRCLKCSPFRRLSIFHKDLQALSTRQILRPALAMAYDVCLGVYDVVIFLPSFGKTGEKHGIFVMCLLQPTFFPSTFSSNANPPAHDRVAKMEITENSF